MSKRGVHTHEMGLPDFDDRAVEALLAGHGQAVDPALAAVLGEVHTSLASAPPVVGAELSALLAGTIPASSASSRIGRTLGHVRSAIIGKVGAAAVLVAATGGLAVAHTLPAPLQDAFSHIGIGAPAHHGHHSSGGAAAETTTTTFGSTATTAPQTANGDSTGTTVPTDTATTLPGDTQGGQVAGSNSASENNNRNPVGIHAGDHHGTDPSGRGDTTPTTTAGGTTTTTIADSTTTTTIADSTTTTSVPHHDHHHRGH